MPSVQKCADLLHEQVNETLTPQIQVLEDEFQDVNKLLAAKIQSIGYKLETLRHMKFPAIELILNGCLRDNIRKRELEGEMLAFFTRGLRVKETQEEILTSLLDSAANCFPRVAIFVVRGDMFKGWSSRGFSDLTAKTISSDEFRQADCSWLLEILANGDREEIADLPDIGSLRLMREESSGAWRLYPLHVFGRLVAIMLAGEAEVAVGRSKALAVLMDCVALRLENIALKIIKNLGASVPESVYAAALAAEPSFKAHAGSESSLEISPDVLNLNLTSPIEIPAPVEYAVEPRPESGAFLPDPLAGLKLVEQPPESVTDISMAASEPEPVVEIPTETTEPEQSLPAAPLPPQNTEEEKLHAAARRFAELLVSGIRLYNEDAVAEGRINRDLYKRLQRDIDRNRVMYEKRVAPMVACRVDYLHDEFVRVLGNGDDGVFGDGYPGPRIGEQQGL